jgi:hypothetical protein
MMVLADVEVKPRVRNTLTIANIFQVQSVGSKFFVKLVVPNQVK